MPAAHARFCSRDHKGPALLLASLFALATGLGLLGLARAVTAPVRAAAPPAAAANVAVVRAFYAAANAVLRTGNAAALDAVLAPGFVDHHPAAGVAPGRDGLVQTLLGRRATFPGLRLVVDHAAGGGDRVTVRVRAEGAMDGTFLGLSLPAAAGAWGPVEVFRVEGAAIAERWGGAPSPLLAQPLWAVPCPAVPGNARRSVVFLERRAYAPGEGALLGGDAAARLVFVESGTLTGVGEATTGGQAIPLPGLLAGAAAELRAPVVLAPGDLVVIPPTGRLAARNDGAAPAAVAIVTVAAHDRLPAGTAPSARASAEVVLPPGATLAAGRLELASGAGLAWANPAGPILVLVEAGRLEAAARNGDGGPATWRTVAAGDGWAAPAGGDGLWQGAPDEPAALFVVTIAAGVGGDADPVP